MRRRVVSPHEPGGFAVLREGEASANLITMVRRVACPSCGASCSPLHARDLQPIEVMWRGPAGGGSLHALLRRPRSFEADCPACRKRALFHIREGRLSFSTDEEAAQIRASARGRARAAYDEDT